MDKNTTLTSALKTQAGTLLENNQLAEARAVLDQLCELSPNDVDSRVKLGVVLRRLGSFVEAEQSCHQALAIQPGYPPAHHALGAAVQQQGRTEEALSCYRKAVSLDPGFVAAHYFLANALRESGQLDEAAMAYQRVLQLNPDHFECLNNLGVLLINLGSSKAAVSHLQHALQLHPDSLVTLVNLGDACVTANQPGEAIRHLQHALDIDPVSANANRALANALHHAGRIDEALASYQQLAELQPGSVEAVMGQARILEQLGKHQESYTLLKPLLEAGNKRAIPIFFDISKHIGRREEAIVLLEDMLQNVTMHDDSKAAIHFRLGKHYDASGDYDRAFHHYEQANALTPAQFNQEKLARFVDDNIMVYSPSFVQRMPRASNREKLPVFIVGMPRSGTSLIEQILASHPDVFGAGELQQLSKIAGQLGHAHAGQPPPLYCLNLTRESLDAAAEQHLRDLQALGGSATRVTDKMPGNICYVGLIQQLFPEAPVIHCTRHPLDTCLSCFFAYFDNAVHDYIYDLKTVGEYYIQYHRLMKHWENVFQDRILRVSYAQLVQEQEKTSREMVDFCGLEWADDCLDFHTTDRFVFTLSYDQVRQPMYTSSLDRWQHYEQYLQPLRDMLEAEGIDCG